jgi:hypothetical protein
MTDGPERSAGLAVDAPPQDTPSPEPVMVRVERRLAGRRRSGRPLRRSSSRRRSLRSTRRRRSRPSPSWGRRSSAGPGGRPPAGCSWR